MIIDGSFNKRVRDHMPGWVLVAVFVPFIRSLVLKIAQYFRAVLFGKKHVPQPIRSLSFNKIEIPR
jgi:hypothetical protein